LYGGKNYNTINKKLSVSKGNYDLEIIQQFDFNKTVDYLIMNDLFPGSAWIFAVKGSVIRQNKILFRTNIIAEDIDWTTKIFKNSSKIDAVNDVYYVYRKNQSDSVTGNAGEKGVKSILSIIEEWYPKLVVENTVLNSYLLHNLGYYYFTSLVLYSNLRSEEKIALKIKMDKLFKVTIFVKTKKLKILKFVYKILGLNLTSKLLSELYFFKEKLI
jgi:hypothetical protein